MQEIGRGRSEVMFSEKVDAKISNLINVKSSFEIEGSKVINDVLKSHVDKNGNPLKPINPLASKEDVIKYVEDLKTHVLPLMPKDFWFGKPNKKGEYGTVFTPGDRVGKLKQAGIYNYYKSEMEKLRSFDGFGESVDGVTDYSKTSYQTLFKEPSRKFRATYGS